MIVKRALLLTIVSKDPDYNMNWRELVPFLTTVMIKAATVLNLASELVAKDTEVN